MSAPRLSIVIATLNRARFIGETLETIVSQVTGEVEVLILDGASTDGTDAVVQGFAKRCPQLRYVRQDKNHGVDRDFDRAVELAAGKYCWLMTDDDLLVPGAVAKVLAALGDEPSLLLVNSEVKSLDLSQVIEPSRLGFSDDRTYGPHELSRLFADVGAYITFIGSVIIDRSLWLSRRREPYFGTLFIHVGVIFQAPLPREAKVLGAPLISIRYGNAMWRPRDFEIWMFKWPDLVWSFGDISEAAKEAVYPKEPWRNLKRLFFFRAKGTYSLEDYEKWIKPRAGSNRARLAALAVAAVPGPLANAAALGWLKFVDPSHGRWLSDTRASRFYFRNLGKPKPSKK
jgi:abequosyltransferase